LKGRAAKNERGVPHNEQKGGEKPEKGCSKKWAKPKEMEQ